MSDLSRIRRVMRWCRYHPRVTGVGALALVALVVIGAVNDPPKDGREQIAQTTPSASASTAAASSSPVPSSSASGAAKSSARLTVLQMTVALADRAQESDRLATGVLATLAVEDRAPKTRYDRDKFGTAWTDDNDNPLGRNGCETRNDFLRRDLNCTWWKRGQ